MLFANIKPIEILCIVKTADFEFVFMIQMLLIVNQRGFHNPDLIRLRKTENNQGDYEIYADYLFSLLFNQPSKNPLLAFPLI